MCGGGGGGVLERERERERAGESVCMYVVCVHV